MGGGGERTEDFDQFRQDKALCELIGHELPAAQTARDFFDQFHEAGLPLHQEGLASVPSESAPLLGLAAANKELILDLQCRKHATPGAIWRSASSRDRANCWAMGRV